MPDLREHAAALRKWADRFDTLPDHERVMTAAADAIDAAAALMDGWTSVAERLPPSGDWVLGYWPSSTKLPRVVQFRDDTREDDATFRFVWYDGDASLIPPTHWMPLPEPPK